MAKKTKPGEITTQALEALPVGKGITCSVLRGFRARKLPSGYIKLGFRYRLGGKQHEVSLGILGAVTLANAQKRVHALAADAAAKIDPLAKHRAAQARATNTVNHVLDRWLADARKRGLKTADTCERIFARLIRPAIGSEVIYDLKRSQVEQLIVQIEDDCGRGMAVAAHGWLRTTLRWWKGKDDEFQTDPIPGGWAPGEARERFLTDEELRDVWLACDETDGVFPQIVRMLILTGCRRMEIGGLHADELKRDDLHGEYIEIAKERMKKGKPHVVPLIPQIKALLPQDRSGLLFTATTFRAKHGPQTPNDGPYNGYAFAKRHLDTIIARRRKADGRAPMPAWCLHDLRRTVRSGMARLGINTTVAELILAHTQGGIVEVYDRWKYLPEKREALTKWAEHVERVLSGGRVVALAAASAGVARIGG